jgi:hypothetical protein
MQVNPPKACQDLGALLGCLFVVGSLHSILVTLVVPRSPTHRISSSHIVRAHWWLLQQAFRRLAPTDPPDDPELLVRRRLARTDRHYHTARRDNSYARRMAVLAALGPLSLLVLFGIWLACLFAGFSLALWPWVDNLGAALALCGSSMLTLGVRAPEGTVAILLCYLAALTSLVTVALVVAYLPTLYSIYNAREATMRMLESRAGRPAWGPELLFRQTVVRSLATLDAFYCDWEAWAAELAETHTSYPWLLLFRSADDLQSWVVSLCAVLDAAALQLVLAPDTAPEPEARQCLRMGFTALRRVADLMGIRYDPDPLPTSAISGLDFAQFHQAIHYLDRAGFPRTAAPDEAWRHFCGWRVNYAEIVAALVSELAAVPARWTGPEPRIPPQQPRHRTPEDIEGNTVDSLRKQCQGRFNVDPLALGETDPSVHGLE